MLKFTQPASCHSPTSHAGMLVQGTEVWEVLSATPTMAANSPSASTLSLIITVTVSISSYWDTNLPKLNGLLKHQSLLFHVPGSMGRSPYLGQMLWNGVLTNRSPVVIWVP